MSTGNQNSKLTKGILFKEPHPNAPDFIVGKLSIKKDDFIEYLKDKGNNGWVNLEIKLSRDGKTYIELDDWKPNNDSSTSNQRRNNDSFDEDEF
jgi:hypothetical protein